MVVGSERLETDLENICSSAQFASSPRLVRLLRFCVEQSLLGKSDNLKESIIGVAVFDRAPGYNLKSDPIVRVTAARLRRKLEEFYGNRDDYSRVIEIPKGSYVAVFHRDVAPPVPNPEVIRAPEPVEPPPTVLSQAPGRVSLRRFRHGLAIFALAAGLLVLFLWFGARQSARTLAVDPLIALPGLAADPAWSPDGETLAFAWNGGAAQPMRVYTLKRGASVPVLVTSSDRSECRPVWSPDGHRIALLRQSSHNEFSLVIIDLSSVAFPKPERVIRTIAQPDFAINMTALDWSPDGKWLVSSEGSNGGGSRHLILIDLANGSTQTITDPPTAVTGDVEARFSPDGQKIAFRRGGEGTLFVLSLDGKGKWQPFQLTELNSGVRGISWSPDGERIFFGSQQNQGYFSLWSVPAKGGKLSWLTPGLDALSPALNSRQNVLAASRQQFDQNLWLYSLDQARSPRILVPSTAVESAPAFSPDGRRLAFVSSRSGALQVWVCGIDDLIPRQLTSLVDARLISTLSWTRDGSSVVYSARRQGRDGAWQTDLVNGKTTALRESDSYSNWPHFSSDGRFLYFISNAEHKFRLWRQTGDQPETAISLLPDLITSFRSPYDGPSLYFLRGGAQTALMRIDPATKQATRVYTFPQNEQEISAWDVASDRLFYVMLDASRCLASVQSVELKDGASKQLGEFPVPSVEHWQPAISASPDGQSVILTRTDRDDATLVAVHLN